MAKQEIKQEVKQEVKQDNLLQCDDCKQYYDFTKVKMYKITLGIATWCLCEYCKQTY